MNSLSVSFQNILHCEARSADITFKISVRLCELLEKKSWEIISFGKSPYIRHFDYIPIFTAYPSKISVRLINFDNVELFNNHLLQKLPRQLLSAVGSLKNSEEFKMIKFLSRPNIIEHLSEIIFSSSSVNTWDFLPLPVYFRSAFTRSLKVLRAMLNFLDASDNVLHSPLRNKMMIKTFN